MTVTCSAVVVKFHHVVEGISSMGNFNKASEVDIPIIYADYYFIEVLLRKQEIAQQMND
ncbi:MAG: hypothetical protein ACLFQS_09105 [Bacteroidales bacterium]